MLRFPVYCLACLSSPASLRAEAVRIEGWAQITDGDSFLIGPVIIRLHGIDAPEAGQTCQDTSGQSWDCGAEARNRLSELADSRAVSCVAIDRDDDACNAEYFKLELANRTRLRG